MSDSAWMDSYDLIRPLGDGTYLVLMPLVYGKRIAIATPDGVGEHWCFTTDPAAAWSSFLLWPVPPYGWSRHMRADGSFEYPPKETAS